MDGNASAPLSAEADASPHLAALLALYTIISFVGIVGKLNHRFITTVFFTSW